MSKLKNASLYTFAALALVSCGNSVSDSPVDEKNKQNDTNHLENTSADLDIKKVSQALGNFIGRNLNAPGIHFDLESIIVGIREGAAGKPSPMNDQEYEKAMSELQQQALTAISKKNLDEANSYLKENAKAKGIVEIVPQKLQFVILQEGQEPTVDEHGSPQITYVGKYIDGTIFGDSSSAGGPITIPLDQTIPGFSQGIKGMKEGEKRRLFVHPEFGYGTSGLLPPNSLLIFDIEVIKASSPEKTVGEFFQADEIDYESDDDFEEADLKK